MKKVFHAFAIMALLVAVSCQKDNSLDETADLTTLQTEDEMMLIASPPLPGSTDSTKGGCRRGGGHHRHPDSTRGQMVSFTDLPAAAKTYLLANADTAKIKVIVKITKRDNSIYFGVRTSDGKHFHFDAQGNLVENVHKGNKFTEITVADLPAAAQNHLTTNNLTSKVAVVVKMTKRDGSTVIYSVMFTDNTRIAFDAAGAVIEKGKKGKKRGG